MQNLASKIEELRNQAGLTSQELAEKAGVSPAYISKLKDGKYKSLSLRTCKRLADGLNLSLREFLEKIGYLENNSERPSFQMISHAFRSKGFTSKEVDDIMHYANYIKGSRGDK